MYWEIINKYIKSDLTKNIYITHVSLVAYKAVCIAKKLDLNEEQIRFIEEAAMLHDIGIIKVDDEELGCFGALPYLAHGSEGRSILEDEGLFKHGLVAERHTGVGISKEEIIENNLPIPHRDMLAESIEEKIISYADLFFSKNPAKLLEEKSMSDVENYLERFGEEKVNVFKGWVKEFR